ncbi:MAG: FtsX-like permease family protein [Planktotalea sp.]|uniref:cell division protein FtsX n=1 Tax=Planktotalea sp. TaxID=2029877 RepID=UPI003C73B91E
MSALRSVLDFAIGDAQAERAVPPTGFTVRLTVFSAAAMAFLVVFALALSLASGRLANRWSEELARSATVRISAPIEQMAAQTEAALNVLRTTEGVESARALTLEEQRDLLAPWFGPELPLDALPLPQMIEVIETAQGFDGDGLRLRLSGEVPGAVLDNHARWRAPLVAAAGSLRTLGWLSILLIAVATGAMITLAANAALAANAQVIAVMRLVGARDAYIAQAFVRRFTLRALTGSAVGTVLGALALLFLPSASEEGGFLTGLGPQGGQWLLLLFIPVLAGVVAFLATRLAATNTLRSLT